MQRLYIRRKNNKKTFEPIIRIMKLAAKRARTSGARARGIVAEPPKRVKPAKVMERIARPERSEGLAQIINVLMC